jgi:hypothetical protein
MPNIGAATVHRRAPTRAELDLTTVPTWRDRAYTEAGSDMATLGASSDTEQLRDYLARGVGQAIIAEEELCAMALEEIAFGADYPQSLPARLLLWLTAV